MFLIGVAMAEAAPTVPIYGATDGGPSVLLSNADNSNPYSGIVRYVGRAQCTGVFVATVQDGADPRDAAAYVLTNGHCPDFPGANEVIINRPAPAAHRVIFNYFADTTSQHVSVPVARIAYATMKGRDIAVLELAARYREIAGRGFVPWQITPAQPAADESVAIVGAPLTGIAATSFLRLAACRLQSRAEVVLEYVWHWFDYERNQCADIRGGSSGSPVLSRSTGHLLALLSTSTVGAARYTDCFLDHPCEPVRADVVSRTDTSYATPLIGVDRCFDWRGRFDVMRVGCPLDADVQVRATPSFLGAENPHRTSALLGPARQRWNVTVSGAFDRYRYKAIPAAGGDCRDFRGYGRPRRVSEFPVIDDPLPPAEGYHFLCVLGGSNTTSAAAWQSIDHPTVVAVRIDATAPRIPARITVNETDFAWSVAFGTLEPEISAYAFKFGRPSDTRCGDPDGYRRALVPFLSLPKANRPYVFCAVPHDSALNQGQMFELVLP